MLDFNELDQQRVYIRQMFLRPQYWGKGIGGSLLYLSRIFANSHLRNEEAVDECALVLETRRNNPAIKLYERKGFVESSDPNHIHYDQGTYIAMSRNMFTRRECIEEPVFSPRLTTLI